MADKRFHTVAVGGTFDHLHAGHQAILTKAFSLGKTVLVGVARGNLLAEKVQQESIQSYDERVSALLFYFKHAGWSGRYQIIPLDTIEGPLGDTTAVEAIVVSEQTQVNAEGINNQRISRGLAPLAIIPISMELNVDREVLTSSAIRIGYQGREGEVYSSATMQLFPVTIPEERKYLFRKPFGKVFSGNQDDPHTALQTCIDTLKLKKKFVVAIGDVTTVGFLQKKIYPMVSIIDYQIQRKPALYVKHSLYFPKKPAYFSVKNPPGTIQYDLIVRIRDAVHSYIYNKERSVIVVDGEEDLAVVPAVLVAPLGSYVLYGLPPIAATSETGVVAIEVTEEKKREMVELVRRVKYSNNSNK